MIHPSSVQSMTAFLRSNPAIMIFIFFPVSHSPKLTVPWAKIHCLATVTSDKTSVRINKYKHYFHILTAWVFP